jgi:hypothetical protein
MNAWDAKAWCQRQDSGQNANENGHTGTASQASFGPSNLLQALRAFCFGCLPCYVGVRLIEVIVRVKVVVITCE